jgi:NAD(P)-dependent dehydrogenase (short-subunit alcohol dehydrogenase family)
MIAAPLNGRVLVATGSSRRVGSAIALRLAADGASVAVNYRRDRGAVDDVVGQIVAAGGTTAVFQAAIDDALS